MSRHRLDLLTEGIWFGEGPRWHDGELWFSDFYAKRVSSVDPAGHVTSRLELGDQPSGLGWLPDGRLLVVSMIDQKIVRLDPGGLVVHADLSSVATFLCNDMVVDAGGRAYVGSFGFDLAASFHERGDAATFAEHPTATLVVAEASGAVGVAATDMHFPNGSVLTDDGSTLIVAETLAARLTAFSVAADGTLHDRRVFAGIPGSAPDGISLDADGRVWVADPRGGRCVLVAEGGGVAAVIETPMPCYACMLGGDDGQTLFMMLAPSVSPQRLGEPRGCIMRTTVDTPHAGLP